ncbi:MAG TPA: SIR2 family protein [Pyrinomonadaceae bacterium]|jgi:hypothetical protein|nr:SIR2 family protein [Pyrinomonadaceae bacterium]
MSEEPRDERSKEPRDIGVQSLREIDWKNLLKQIRKGTCVPFIGPDVCAGVYPSKAQIAQKWAAEEEYPLEDRSDLARVAQFLAVQNAPAYPVDKLIEEYENIRPPDFTDRSEPHRVLADLPLPLYITTNYDQFMSLSLQKVIVPRNARRDFCRWRQTPGTSSVFAGEYSPTPANPLVFHLFGYMESPASLVLTEHDYLKFLVNVSKEAALIPALIRGAIAEGSLLFTGYHFNDWDFRVLIHTIANYLENNLGKAHVSVVTPDTHQEAAIYLKLYFRNLDLRIFWGTSQEFLAELRRRWEAFSNG